MSVPLATLELLSTSPTQEPLGTIAMPIRDHVNAATVLSILSTDWSFAGGIGGMKFTLIQGNMLPLQRNEAIQRMRGHFLLFIDDDMVWQPGAISQLVDTFFELDHQFDEPVIVGGLCFRRTPPYQPTLFMRERPNDGPWNFLEKWDTDIVEVDATGMAFVLIPKTAIEAIAEIEMPPFDVRDRQQGQPEFFQWMGKMGEDLRFCANAKAKGVRIFVDTRIEIGHISEVAIGHRHFLDQIAHRSVDLEDARREVNTRMGLPTLSADEAEKLANDLPFS